MNKISNVLWGLLFIAVGVIFGSNALGYTDINIFFDGWWTLFIIIPCFIGLFKDRDITGNLIGLTIGICLLLSCQDVIHFDMIWKLIVPVVLVIIGLSLVFKDTLNNKVKKEIKKLNKTGNKEYCATFSTQDVNFSKEEFDGCDLSGIFGSVKCDLRETIIKNDVVIDASAVFGSITIYVPENVNVKVASTSIFGGVSDNRREKTKDAKITLYINTTALFGGVELK